MKIFTIILFITLVIYIQSFCTKWSDATKYECKERQIGIGEDLYAKYCCFLHTKNGNDETKQCFPYSQDAYDNIEKTIENYESLHRVTVVSLYCQSSYLQMGLLGVLFFLL
jgi:hypothetical protein